MDVKLENVLKVPSMSRIAQINIHTFELHPMFEITQSVIFAP